MPDFSNLAAYKFAPLTDLKERRAELLAHCQTWGLKGTILLSNEGINLFVAGLKPQVNQLLAYLRTIPGLADLTPKLSESSTQPFSRMLVRIKKEIIAFGLPEINPGVYTSPKLAPQTLKSWLDEGRPITLLDTRNDYEVKQGTFVGAHTLGISHFRDFPAAAQALPCDLKDQPVVMFCTGGIRCEKAGPYLEQQGFRQVFQLEGGILQYFEECGGAHYRGECYVFDKRTGLDPSLEETGSTYCFNCLTPLTTAEQTDPRYQVALCCPYCFKTSDQQQAEILAQRHTAIRAVTTPLPGSQPYDNYRPVTVSPQGEGLTLEEFLPKILPQVSWQEVCAQGDLLAQDGQSVSLQHRIRAGERYLHLIRASVEPEVNPQIRILYEDAAIVILDKPAPLPLHPSGRFNRNTLQAILHRVYQPEKPQAAHRIDANTTGLVVCARTRHFARLLQPQFARGEVTKRYLVRIQGHPPWDQFQSEAPISSQPGALGTRTVDPVHGLAACTEFQVRARLADGTALLEACPLTGRTNQIRVHLWQLGWPVCGEQVYLLEQRIGTVQTAALSDPPLCLHAWRLAFNHPLTHQRVHFEAALPEWAQQK